MTIVQVVVRDEPESVDEFLRACGVAVVTSLPVDVMANRVHVPDTFTFSFGGLAPLPLDGARGVLAALDPKLHRETELRVWGCPSIADAIFMRMRWVVPEVGAERAAAWSGVPPKLLEVALSLACDGVPDGWFTAAAARVRWSKLLWFAANHAAGATAPYGAIFASSDGALQRPPWEDVSQLIGQHFLNFNGWVAETSSPSSLLPLAVSDPAFRDESRVAVR